jgi:transposase-like protein
MCPLCGKATRLEIGISSRGDDVRMTGWRYACASCAHVSYERTIPFRQAQNGRKRYSHPRQLVMFS